MVGWRQRDDRIRKFEILTEKREDRLEEGLLDAENKCVGVARVAERLNHLSLLRAQDEIRNRLVQGLIELRVNSDAQNRSDPNNRSSAILLSMRDASRNPDGEQRFSKLPYADRHWRYAETL